VIVESINDIQLVRTGWFDSKICKVSLVKNLNPRTAKILLGLMAAIFLAALIFGGGGNKDTVQLVVDGDGEAYVGDVMFTEGPPDNRVVHRPEVFRSSDGYKGIYAPEFKGENITVDAEVRRDENALPGKRLTISLLDEDGNIIATESTFGYDLIWVSNDPSLSG